MPMTSLLRGAVLFAAFIQPDEMVLSVFSCHHLLQGFHRYSTDARWHVPHFEKMLYDQGQLAATYALAYQVCHVLGRPRLQHVCLC